MTPGRGRRKIIVQGIKRGGGVKNQKGIPNFFFFLFKQSMELRKTIRIGPQM